MSPRLRRPAKYTPKPPVMRDDPSHGMISIRRSTGARARHQRSAAINVSREVSLPRCACAAHEMSMLRSRRQRGREQKDAPRDWHGCTAARGSTEYARIPSEERRRRLPRAPRQLHGRGRVRASHSARRAFVRRRVDQRANRTYRGNPAESIARSSDIGTQYLSIEAEPNKDWMSMCQKRSASKIHDAEPHTTTSGNAAKNRNAYRDGHRISRECESVPMNQDRGENTQKKDRR